MAEDTKASTGAKSQFWLHDGSALYQLRQVKNFKIPSPELEELECTHLDSDAKEYAPGDTDFGEFDVVLNFRPGSDTDTKLEAALAAQTERAFAAHVAVRKVLTRSYTGNCLVKKIDRGEVNRQGIMEATVTCRATGTVTSAPYS